MEAWESSERKGSCGYIIIFLSIERITLLMVQIMHSTLSFYGVVYGHDMRNSAAELSRDRDRKIGQSSERVKFQTQGKCP
jgi:hypothetical protein